MKQHAMPPQSSFNLHLRANWRSLGIFVLFFVFLHVFQTISKIHGDS